MSAPKPSDIKPSLPPGVRLHHDKVRGVWVLLAPESLIETNAVAVEIIRRCTGTASIAEIIDDLATSFDADRDRIERDVHALLADMSARRLVLI